MINLKKQMRAMETETIQKNEVSPKDLNRRSRGNFLVFGMVLLAFCFFANNTMAQTWNIGNPGYNANVKATLSGNTLTISGTGNMCDFWDSTEGEAPWYVNRTSIQAVTIQSGVTNIGNRAFHDCNNLRTISIPNTVAIIGRQAFFNCTNTNFQLITLPNSVAEIEGEAFKNCTSLKTLIIDEGSSNLKFTRFRYPDKSGGTYFYGWFENCPIQTLSLRRQCSYDGGTLFSGNNYLQTLIIGRNVTSIGSSAFADCGGLKNVTLEEGSQNLLLGSRDAETVFSNCPILTLSLGRKICTYYHGVVGGALSFSASVKSPFYNKTTLKTVSIENSITSIEGYTFDGCNSLSSVSIGNIVASIGDAAFRNCSALTNISIPNSVTALGSSAFSGSGLTSIIIPASITNIGSSAFADCSGLKNVTLLEGSQNLLFGSRDAETVFSNCPILTLSLGRKICTYYHGVVGGALSFSTSVKSPFYNKTTLKTVSIENSITSIEGYTFDGCNSLSSVSIGNIVASIGDAAFRNCSALTNISIPNSVTALGSSAFSGSGLTSIIIPASITNIGGSAFADCSGLKNVTLLEGSQNLLFGSRDAETVFSNCPIITLSLGRKIYTHYNGVVGGAASFSTSFKSPFYNKTTLDMLSIGSNTPSITDYTFYGCTGLTQITSNATTPPTIQSNTFTNVSRTINVKVPCNYLNAYRANQYWNTFTNMNDGGCTSGIADITTVNFQIYPNPAQDEIFIQSELLIQEVEIYDISGRLVETLRARSLPNNVQTINVSALPRGVYMLRIYTDKGLTNSKFMKE